MTPIKSILIVFSSAVSLLPTAHAAKPNDQRQLKQEIRFYKINTDNITQKIPFTKRKARKPGCHNFIKKARLHRTVQFAYKQCHVFAEKECQADSIMTFYKEKEPALHSTRLTQGYGWYPVGDHPQGEKAKSWFCE